MNKKNIKALAATLVGILGLAGVASAAPILKNRYSFNDTPGGTTVTDSVGGKNGTLTDVYSASPANSSFTGNSLYLNYDGAGNASGWDYVRLPAGMISIKTNLTLEVWYRRFSHPEPPDDNWMRIWDFGSYNGSSLDTSTGGRSYFCGQSRNYFTFGTGFEFQNNVDTHVEIYRNPPVFPADGWTHLALVYNYSSNVSKLYINGKLAAGANWNTAQAPLSSIEDTNCVLGMGQWGVQNTAMIAEYDEFRLWEGELSREQLKLSFDGGPDVVATNTGSLLSLSINLASAITAGGGAQCAPTADYQNVTGVDVTRYGAQYFSSNPGVATVNTNGLVSGITAGAATISAVYGGLTNSQLITVTAIPAVLKNRWSFNETVGTLTCPDSIGGSNGVIVNGAGVGGDFNGTGQLVLNGGSYLGNECDTGGRAYVDLPNKLVSSRSNITFEIWVTWTGAGDWQRILDFGQSTAGEGCQREGSHALNIIPRRGSGKSGFESTFWGNDPLVGLVEASAPLPQNQEVYLVAIYDPVNGVQSYYVDGVFAGGMAKPLMALSNFNDQNCWLGRSQWKDDFFQGQYDELRIWEGVLTPAEIAQHKLAGPNSLVALPQLSVALTGANMIVSWPTSGSSGYTLKGNSGITGGAWTTVTPAPTIVGANYQVTLPHTNSARFFRLQNP